MLCVDFAEPQILKFTKSNDSAERMDKKTSKTNINVKYKEKENENENSNNIKNHFFGSEYNDTTNNIKSDYFHGIHKSKNTTPTEHSFDEYYSSEYLEKEKGKKGRENENINENVEESFFADEETSPSKPTANSIYTVKLAVNGRNLECRKHCTFSPSLTGFLCPLEKVKSENGSVNNSNFDIKSIINDENRSDNNENTNTNNDSNNDNNEYNDNYNNRNNVKINKNEETVNTIHTTHTSHTTHTTHSNNSNSSTSSSVEGILATLSENLKLHFNNISNGNNNENNNNNNNDNNNDDNNNYNNSNNHNKKSLNLSNLNNLLTFDNNNFPKIVTPRSEIKVNRELIFGFYDTLTNSCFEGYVRSLRVYSSPHRLRKFAKNGKINDDLREFKDSNEIENIENFRDKDIFSVKYLNKLQLPFSDNSSNNNNNNNNSNSNISKNNDINTNYNNNNDNENNNKSKNFIILKDNYNNTNTNRTTMITNSSNKSTKSNTSTSISKIKPNNQIIKNHITRVFPYKKTVKNFILPKPVGPILTKNAIYAVLHDLPANKIISTNNCGHSGQYRGKLVNKW